MHVDRSMHEGRSSRTGYEDHDGKHSSLSRGRAPVVVHATYSYLESYPQTPKRTIGGECKQVISHT